MEKTDAFYSPCFAELSKITARIIFNKHVTTTVDMQLLHEILSYKSTMREAENHVTTVKLHGISIQHPELEQDARFAI